MEVLEILFEIALLLTGVLLVIVFGHMTKAIRSVEKERAELIKENKELEIEKNIYKHLREFNQKIADEKEEVIKTYTKIIMSLEEELKSVREEAYKSKKTVRKSTTSKKTK